jgi:tripartite-type tricarboxylate transporter receptor subunit TctC
MVRAGTPRDVLVKLSDALRYALSDKELIARITADGGDPSFMSSEAFGELIAKDMNDALKISGDLKLPKD